MDEKIQALRERLVDLHKKMETITAVADDENRDLSADELQQLKAFEVEVDRTKEEIARRERIAAQKEELAKPTGRKTEPSPTETYKLPAELKDGKLGFKSLGDFAVSVYRACVDGGIADKRLANLAPTTWGSESVGADGGFAVPETFRSDIMQKVLGEESLLPRCDLVPTPSNSFTMVIDDTTPWQTSGGIQAAWLAEAGSYGQSKPKVKEEKVRLNKVGALVPITEELLDDQPALDNYLRAKAPAKIAFRVNHAIVQGDGNGKPMGILPSPSVVSVAKETSQVAATLVGANVIKMWSRLYAPLRGSSVWLINQDLEPQLFQLTLPGRDNTGAAATGWGSHVYLPPNGLSQSPFGSLMGRPVIPTQACPTLGSKGDIILTDLKQYLALLKNGGPNPRVETSMHLWFDSDVMAYKFVLRVGGQPWWPTAIDPASGNNTLSWAVTLDERA